MKRFSGAVLFALCLSLAFAGAGYSATPPAAPKLRLGDSVWPVRSAVDLTVVPELDSFSGSVDIDIDIRSASSVIWLNALELNVKSALLTRKGATITALVVPGNSDFVGFEFPEPLSPGPARLHVTFEGKFAKVATHGLFQQKEGESWYVYSQFEPTDARRAFPSFDEPSFKIPWQLTLHVKKEQMAVSNTPVVSETVEPNGMKRVLFAETKPLPAYLVAFGVGPFDVVDAGRAGRNKTAIRIIVPRGKKDEARYAAQVTGELLERLESYFGIPYPYEKLDNLAIPQTVGFGAMENAGLITYGSGGILARPQDDSIRFRRGYASVAAHEMAHQWFGDLVTTAWWNDIWLNESFATWMAAKIVDQWKPEWGGKIGKVASRSGSMGGDTLISARRIRQPIESKNDIANAFDNISYGKGAAVLSMFESWMGEEKFRKGVQSYLAKHAFKNATAADFLSALNEAGGPEVGPAFSTFLEQAGVPLVTVDLRCEKGAPARLLLSQRRFLPFGSKGSSAQLWRIPVCASYGVAGPESRACTLLTTEKAELVLGAGESCPSWVLANDKEAGYYRTAYKGDLLRKLVAGNGKALTVPERLGVLGDIRALVETGELSMGDALSLVPDFAHDADRHIVSATADLVQELDDHLVPSDLRPNYIRFVQKNYGERARALGLTSRPGEDEETRLLRAGLTGLVGRVADDPVLLKEAGALARGWLSDRKGVDADSIGTVLFLAARGGDRELFGRYVAEARKTEDRRERRRLLGMLNSFRDPALLKEALALVLNGGFDIRESFSIVWGALGESRSREEAYAFVKQNFDALAARLPHEGLGSLPYVGASFCDESHRADVEAFFKPRVESFEGGPRNLAQTLERVSLCSAVRSSQQESVAAFLKGQ